VTVHVAVTIALDLRQEEANSQETIIAVTAQPAQKRNHLGIHSITIDPQEESGVRRAESEEGECGERRVESAVRSAVPIAIGILEEEMILVKERNVLIKEEKKTERAVHHFHEVAVIPMTVKNVHIKEEKIAEKVAHHFQEDVKTDRRAEIAEHLLLEAEAILMTEKNALIGEQRAESGERSHLVKNVLTRNVKIVQREVKGEECIKDARKVLRDSRESDHINVVMKMKIQRENDPLRGRSLESRVRRILKENVHIKEETIVKVDLEKNAHIKEEMIMLVDSGENVLFRETKKEKEVRREDPIVSDRQVEKIVMHALKKNHLTEIAHLTEKVELVVERRVSVMQAQEPICQERFV